MKYQLATIIVTNAVRNNLRLLAGMLDKGDMSDMFITPLSATGNLPATHWVSSGHMPKPLIRLIRNPVQMFTVAKKAWEDDGKVFPFTQTQITSAMSKCSVNAGTSDTEQPLPVPPQQAIANAGLKMITGTLP